MTGRSPRPSGLSAKDRRFRVVGIHPAQRYVPLLGRKRSGLCPRQAEWPAGKGDVTALIDSCSVLRFPLLSSLQRLPICPSQSEDNLPTGPETWLCRPWAVDSSFFVWDSPILRWPVEWGDHQRGAWGSLQLWVLCSHSPGIRKNQRPPPLGVQLPLAVCQSSYPVGYDTCPNASSGSEADEGQPRSRSVAVCAWDRNQSKITPRHAISTRASQRAVPVCRDIHRKHESRISGSPGRWSISRVAGRWARKGAPVLRACTFT